jgi:inosose dehydratase
LSGIRVANAPSSYGAFEITVGILPDVPEGEHVLAAIAAAGNRRWLSEHAGL